MKRWTLRILLCLIIGAITTVAVAWGCMRLEIWPDNVRYEQHTAIRQLMQEFGGQLQFYGVAGAANAQPAYAGVTDSVGRTLDWMIGIDPDGRTWSRYDCDAGVPCRALRGTVRLADSAPELIDAIPGPGFATEDYLHYFPLRPIWPGFVIDTLFYAAIWGGVWFGFVGGKRFIRSKRGRCPRCGYDLRGDLEAGCSECGWNREGAEGQRGEGAKGAES